jgi:hypothetical protein
LNRHGCPDRNVLWQRSTEERAEVRGNLAVQQKTHRVTLSTFAQDHADPLHNW